MIFQSVNKQGQDVCLAVSPDETIILSLSNRNNKMLECHKHSIEAASYMSKAYIIDSINTKYNLLYNLTHYFIYKDLCYKYSEIANMYTNVFGIKYEEKSISFKLLELKNYDEKHNLDLSWLEFFEK